MSHTAVPTPRRGRRPLRWRALWRWERVLPLVWLAVGYVFIALLIRTDFVL